MAQFSEVMKQAKRMCKSFSDGCRECPIGDADELKCGITVTSEMDCKEVERRVMQWAAKHPESVYPTWLEWQKSTFPDAGRYITPCEFGSYDQFKCVEIACNKCMKRQIPAAIAEKLGIKPKEAK